MRFQITCKNGFEPIGRNEKLQLPFVKPPPSYVPSSFSRLEEKNIKVIRSSNIKAKKK